MPLAIDRNGSAMKIKNKTFRKTEICTKQAQKTS